MKRTQIQLDEETYEQLRKAAYERKTSVAGVIREAVSEYLVGGTKPEPKRKLTLADFPWIGMASVENTPPDPNSTDWGDVLYEEYLEQSAEYERRRRERES